VASYSAGRDIPAKLIPEPSTGTKLDIAANDQARPIATTTAIPTIHARICIPLRGVELADSGLHFFSPPRCEVVHGCAKFFEARAEEGKRNCNERANGLARR